MIRTRSDAPHQLAPPHAETWGGRDTADEPPILRLEPFISVLVPVRNEGRFIESTLTQLLRQNYPRFEVVVADGESDDDTREQVAALQVRHPNLRLVSNPGIWSSAGRNAALAASRGDIVLVVDGHCELDNVDYLRELADAFARSDADCVGRPQPLDVSQATPVQRAVAACRSSRLGHHPDSFIYSSEERIVKASSIAVAYRRRVFDEVGPFDERFDACEDVELNHRLDRAGMRCLFTPRIALRYHPRGTLLGLFGQMRRYGRGRARLARKHPDTFSLPGFVPALFVLGLIVGPFASLVSPWLALGFAGCVGLYLLLVLATSLSIALRERDARMLVLAPLVFAAVHVGAGWGIVLELVRPGRPPQRREAVEMPVPFRRAA